MKITMDTNLSRWSAAQIVRSTPRLLRFALKNVVKPERAFDALCLSLDDGPVFIQHAIFQLPLRWSYCYCADFTYQIERLSIVNDGRCLQIAQQQEITFWANMAGREMLQMQVSSDQLKLWNIPSKSEYRCVRIDFGGKWKGDYFNGEYAFPSLHNVALL